MKSVVDYFHETYGFIIKHTQLPCLQVGNQQRSNYLPMEVNKCYSFRHYKLDKHVNRKSLLQVCKIVEGQRYSRRLNERQITALLKVTCQRPHERERDIIQVGILESVLYCQAYMQCTDFTLHSVMLDVWFTKLFPFN